MPASPGSELSGIIDAVGSGVSSLQVGQAALVSARELPVRGGCYTEAISNSPWIRGAPHSGLARLIARISSRTSAETAGRPGRRLDFQRQYDRKPARCQRRTVSGRTTASASRAFGNSQQTHPSNSLSMPDIFGRLGLPRRDDLLAQHQNLSFQCRSRPEKIDDECQNQPDEVRHPRSVARFSAQANRIQFTTGTAGQLR